MANWKVSSAKKKLRGTFRQDRVNTEVSISTEKLGPAPAHMVDEEKATWKEIAKRIPEGIATGSDRISFEILVWLMVKFRSGEISGTETTLLLRAISKFGLSPQDRDSVSAVPPKKKETSRWLK